MYLAIAHNWNIQRADVPTHDEEIIVREGYNELLDLYAKHPKARVDHFISGYTALRLSESYPRTLDELRAGVSRGQFQIGTYTYTHPVFPLLPYNDSFLQVKRGLEIDQHVWGLRPQGMIMPELAWDPTLPKIFNDLGLGWAILPNSLYKQSVKEWSLEELHHPVWVQGIDGSQIVVVFASYELPVGIYRTLMATARGEITPDRALAALDELQKADRKGDFLVIYKADAEIIYTHSLRGYNGVKSRFDRLIGALEEAAYVNFTTISDYLSNHKPEKSVYLRAGGGHAELRAWVAGSEKVHLLYEEARNALTAAEFITLLAEKLGADTKPARRSIEKGWQHLALAENSDGITTAWKPEVYPKPSRIFHDYEHALRAREAAQKAVKCIEFKMR